MPTPMPDYNLQEALVHWQPATPHCDASCVHLKEAWQRGFEAGARAEREHLLGALTDADTEPARRRGMLRDIFWGALLAMVAAGVLHWWGR